MAISDLSICNNALLLVGANEITSFNDNTNEAYMCNRLYAITRDALLEEGNWTFLRTQVRLARTDSSHTEYAYEYQIPGNVLRIFKKDTARNDYEIYGDKLLSNDSDVYIYASVDPGEHAYPATFVRALEYKMAAVLAAALEHDESMAQLFENLHTQALRKARRVDGQQQPNKSLSGAGLRPLTMRMVTNGKST